MTESDRIFYEDLRKKLTQKLYAPSSGLDTFLMKERPMNKEREIPEDMKARLKAVHEQIAATAEQEFIGDYLGSTLTRNCIMKAETMTMTIGDTSHVKIQGNTIFNGPDLKVGDAFHLRTDGTIMADWKKIYEAKEAYLKDPTKADHSMKILAALWFARNT